MWANFHTHTTFCDGKGTMNEYCEEALRNGMIALGFSSHAPLPFEKAWAMKPDRLESYIASVSAVKSKYPSLQIYSGLEVDYIPGLISPLQFKKQLDYTIGSIHFVDACDDGTPWEIDGTQQLFDEGLSSIFKNNIKDALHRYFELTRTMVSQAPPTIVGHLDKIKMQNSSNHYFSENDKWYQDEVLHTLKEIQKAGCMVEVNTRGVYQKKTTTLYPSPWVIEQMKALQIPIVLNSDAHHSKDLTTYFTEAASSLLTLGYTEINILYEGRWKRCPFDSTGLKID